MPGQFFAVPSARSHQNSKKTPATPGGGHAIASACPPQFESTTRSEPRSDWSSAWAVA